MALAFGGLAAVAALVFSLSDQSSRIAADAEIGLASAALSESARSVQGGMAFSLVLVSAEQAGVPASQDSGIAIERTVQAIEDMRRRAERLDGLAGSDTGGAVEAAAAAIVETFARLPDVAAAEQAAETAALPRLADVATAADAAGRGALARVAAERSEAGRVAAVSSLLVALIVPGLAVLTVWAAQRRRFERARLEAELESQRELGRARDDLIAGLSHQLRTPLTAILGFADLLRASEYDHQAFDEGLGTIQEQAHALSRSIDDLMVMSRIEGGAIAIALAPIDPTPEIRTVASSFAGAPIELDLRGEGAMVNTDRLRLRHILRNLISNAVQHGGPSITVKAAPTGAWYRVVVADDGPGLPATEMESLFFPAMTAESVTGTLGLGLAVSRRLADELGCSLTYRRFETLTAFVLDIPLLRHTAELENQPA